MNRATKIEMADKKTKEENVCGTIKKEVESGTGLGEEEFLGHIVPGHFGGKVAYVSQN